MRNVLNAGVAAALLAATVVSFEPSAASAGVVGLSDQNVVTPASATEQVYWRSYCHRRWVGRRHYGGYYGYSGVRTWGYAGGCRTCGGCGTYGSAYPGYYGYGYPGYGAGWGGGSGLLGLGILGIL
jgi:hypothetical protein